MAGLIFIAVMLVLLWVLLIAPQRRRQQAQRRMVDELRPGLDVLTAGGVYGTVVAVRDDDLTLEIAPGTTVRLDKRAVASIVSEDETEAGAELDEAALADELPEPYEERSQPGRT